MSGFICEVQLSCSSCVHLLICSVCLKIHTRFTTAWSLERWCRFGFSFAEVDCVYDWSICSFWTKFKVFEAILEYLADDVLICSWICCCRWLFEAVSLCRPVWKCLQANAGVSLDLLQFFRFFWSFHWSNAFERLCRYFILQALAFICKHLQAHASLLKALAVIK